MGGTHGGMGREAGEDHREVRMDHRWAQLGKGGSQGVKQITGRFGRIPRYRGSGLGMVGPVYGGMQESA